MERLNARLVGTGDGTGDRIFGIVLSTWRIIPVRQVVSNPPFISHEFCPFGRGPTTLLRGLTMVVNHLLIGMILQVVWQHLL